MFGAGFSKWCCDLPLVSELFDYEIRFINLTEKRRINKLNKIHEFWKDKYPDKNNEEFVLFSQGPSARLNLVNWYITRCLTEPFFVNLRMRFTWHINSRFAESHEGIGVARHFLEGLINVGDIDVITTNYDLIVEYALGTGRFNYGVVGEQIDSTPHPHSRPVYLTGDIAVAKLHGSISWSVDQKFADLRCGLTGKSLIVPPMIEKRVNEQLISQ